MSKSSSGQARPVNWILVALIAAGVALFIAYKASPKESALRRAVQEAPAVLAAGPERVKQLRQYWRKRLQQATVTFQGARLESEKSLLLQLKDAKQRGSSGSG